jgi:hypothetical protein
MLSLPTSPLGLFATGGAVSILLTGLGYLGKKVIDIAADVLKARFLKEHPKKYIFIYGADDKVAKRVTVDYRR